MSEHESRLRIAYGGLVKEAATIADGSFGACLFFVRLGCRLG